MRLQPKLCNALLQEAHRRTVAFTFLPIACDAVLRIEPLKHRLQLLLRNEALLIRGNEVVAIAVLVHGALSDEALGLCHIPHVDDVPHHRRVPDSLEHVADACLPSERLVMIFGKERPDDMARHHTETLNAHLLRLGIDILFRVLFAHSVGDVPIPFHHLHVPNLWLLVHGGPGGLCVLVALRARVAHCSEGAGVNYPFHRASSLDRVYHPLCGIEAEPVHALRGWVGAIVAQLGSSMKNCNNTTKCLVVGAFNLEVATMELHGARSHAVHECEMCRLVQQGGVAHAGAHLVAVFDEVEHNV
mmetsp:Transcript_19866/g.42342  ORF Transcript_19866/g.42342 Transcript_19866/m.42342 type:complete len:302 (+) Transcript_19866:331-1236(+)